MKLKHTIIILSVIIQANAFAQSSDSLSYYMKIAAENNQGVRAAFSVYQASLQKIPQAGAYEDPQLNMGFFLQPMELVEGRQVGQFQLMQMFPWFGTRKAARTEAQHMAKMAGEQFRDARDQLWLDVYTQWFTLGRLQQQLNNYHENRQLLVRLEELALRKFASPSNNVASGIALPAPADANTSPVNAGSGMSGMGSMGNSAASQSQNTSMSSQGNMPKMGGSTSGMPDVLRVQLEMAEVDNSIESILSEIEAEKAKFNALLNRSPESEVNIPDSLIRISFVLDAFTVKEQIKQQNPMLGMLTEEEYAYRAKADMDRKMSYPMFGIGLQYMLINKAKVTEMDMEGGTKSMNGKDMIMPMVTVSIPVFRNKYKAQQRESAYLQQASHEKYLNTLNMLEAEIYRIKKELDNADRKITLYIKQSELAQATYNLMTQELASGRGDLTNVIQVQRQLLDYKVKTSDAIAAYNTMVANVQKLISSNEE